LLMLKGNGLNKTSPLSHRGRTGSQGRGYTPKYFIMAATPGCFETDYRYKLTYPPVMSFAATL
jgi:hypothetical protein